MSKIKQYIDLMTPMEAYQKGYDKGQEDVCTVGVSDIYEKGYKQGYEAVWTDGVILEFFNEGKKVGRQEVVEWVEENSKEPICLGASFRAKWQAQLKKWGIKND